MLQATRCGCTARWFKQLDGRLTVSTGDLLFERVDRTKRDITPLAAVNELRVLNGPAAQDAVEATEDVLRYVHSLGGFGDAAIRDGPHLVPHVGVAVVEAHTKRIGKVTLHHRAKDKLVTRSKGGDGTAAL